MKVLSQVYPTPEQLTILHRSPTSLLIIRGAAGSGKTTTALLRLKYAVDFWQKQFAREGSQLNVLVLTYNRTLAGYVEALANEQVRAHSHVSMSVSTFGRWARELLGEPSIVDGDSRTSKIQTLGLHLGLRNDFLVDEVNYITGRFLPPSLEDYLDASRDGRGASPAVPRKTRVRLLKEVVAPLREWKLSLGVVDFEDMAASLATSHVRSYDVIVVDETQDFTANQVRAVREQASTPASITFVLDAAQRIYPHSFRWKEVGIEAAGAVQQLKRNYRNTVEIAAFARPIIDGIDHGDDGTLPDFSAAQTHGALPNVLVGLFSEQMQWAIGALRKIDLHSESVAFLHIAGWFDEVKRQLQQSTIPYCELSRTREYPVGPTNVALSTMHSAKGLEFDHVFILGLAEKNTPHGEDDGDVSFEKFRRLLAMAIGRARKTVTVGYKPGEESGLVRLLKKGTYTTVKL